MKKKIAVFTTGWASEILSQFLTGMTEELSSESADIFLFLNYAAFADGTEKRQGQMNIYDLPDLKDFDGAVIFGSGLDYKDRVDRIISRCNDAGIPVVLQGSERDGVSFVGSDNYGAMKELCAHVINEHGAKTLAFFAGSKDSFDSESRLQAIRDYVEENNCKEALTEVYYTNWENAAVTKRIEEMCADGQKLPDVIICANDGLAMEACITLDNCGYRVPEDVIVTGFDYLEQSKVFSPSVASVDQCFDAMGAASIKLIRRISQSGGNRLKELIPCKFIPGESCNCYKFRNSDLLRRRMGRDAFSHRSMTTYFNRKLDIIDSTVLSCLTYLDLKEDMHHLFAKDHVYEGESFHMLLEPTFGLSIYDSNIKMNTEGYCDEMEVIYSAEDGKQYREGTIKTSDLIPGYKGDGSNHMYVFLPLHENAFTYGYLIFRDCMEKVENHFLMTYCNRMSLALEKFRYALTLEHINKRLLDLMGKDPLTNVNNRMAYEEKEKELQSQIDSSADLNFAMAMFDVNNLKTINDSHGHEAGDEYLIRACQLICQVFKRSPVYRIGGDEFVAVLCGEDYKDRDVLLLMLNKMMSPYTDKLPLPDDYVSIACGIAAFDRNTDTSVADVIKRADENMYRDKASKKEHEIM